MNSKTNSALLALIVAGTVFFGVIFYWRQLAETPLWLWIFVPDCPLYVLLAAPILLFGIPKNAAFRFVVSCGLAIYGSWTIFVLLLYYEYYFVQGNVILSLVLLAGHALMIVGAIFVLPKKGELRIGAVFMAFGWFALNLWADYFNGALSTYPRIPTSMLEEVVLFTIAASIVWPGVLAAISMSGMHKNGRIDEIKKSLLR